MTYEQNKPSVPLAITVPHYNAVEFLSASSYLTQMGIISPHILPHDLFSKCRHFLLLRLGVVV